MAEKRFIVAANKMHADATAVIDQKWERNKVKGNGWINSAGYLVEYAASAQSLRGMGRGVTIYLGYGWERNEALRDLREIARFNEYILVELSGPTLEEK